jgi:hypothetical protein
VKVQIPFRSGVTTVCRRAAFSLIEILVTVGLLSVITLGLVMVFSQTQRAFKLSMAQVDVLEAGRAVSDMLARELSEMAPSYLPAGTNYFAVVDDVNFATPLLQSLPGSSVPRTNVLQRFFFLTRMHQNWSGIGYQVVPDYRDAGVGTLYRFVQHTDRTRVPQLSQNFLLASANLDLTNRVAEGIVHLRLRAYDNVGKLITPFWPTNNAMWVNTARAWNYQLPDQVDSYFASNALPAFVELEVGILEPEAVERFKSIGTANVDAQRKFLEGQAAQVHLFRQRIAIRNVDPSLYQ